MQLLNVERPPQAVVSTLFALCMVAGSETTARLLNNRGHLTGGLFYFLNVEIMNPNPTPSRQHRPSRFARLLEQLNQARQERAAAVSFILTIRRWDEFKQYINLTSCRDYEELERQIINGAREAYSRQRQYIETHKRHSEPSDYAEVKELRKQARTAHDELLGARNTLRIYAQDINRQRAQLIKERERAGTWQDCYNDLYARAVGSMPPGDMRAHREFLRRVTRR